MAIFKDTARKGGRNYKTLTSMRKVIDYVMRLDKVKSTEFILGKNCDTTCPYLSFLATKKLAKSITGRQCKQFVQSFEKYQDIDPEVLKQIAEETMNNKLFDGYQVLTAIHFDTTHRHIHYIVNSVSYENGLKWKHSTKDMENMIQFTNELCEKYNLKSLENSPHKKTRNISRGELEARAQGRSWKRELYLNAVECKKDSISREDFISKMNEAGYKVNWTDSRKYITFTEPSGKKLRNANLDNPEEFTKEALEKRFDLNSQRNEYFNVNIKNSFSHIENEIESSEIHYESKTKSWKHEMYLAITRCKNESISRTDFINKMMNEGYTVKWSDTRKDITFTNVDSKSLRNSSFNRSDLLTKEELEKSFILNEQKNKFNENSNQLVNLDINEDLSIAKNIEKVLGDPLKTPTKGFKLSLLELEGKVNRKDERKEVEKGRGISWEKEK